MLKDERLKAVALIAALTLTGGGARVRSAPAAQWDRARARAEELRLASYATSRQVEQLATDESYRDAAWKTIRRTGLTKLYLEVYRGGHVVSVEHLTFVRDWCRARDLLVVGGIATVPGADFGVRQKGPLGWFNWQNEKTQCDLERVVRMAASVFDTFIVDDFLCTGDVSDESNRARGDRSWGEYRRALLTELARTVFVGPAKQVNPNVTMIVKYPQWYDRFHLFGYDTRTFPEVFDQVWVGTETRGRHTRRFGFVQPYEGFINYRWLAGIAGEKAGGAWFDHGDCGEHDFLDQAYTSVLAGAQELVFFNLGNVIAGHPDHDKVIAQFDRLADLAVCVRENPVAGVPAYKPPNSDPGGDMYLMDFLGMLGIPLAPVHTFPKGVSVVFLPAQAATDTNLDEHIGQALAGGAHVIVTSSLLARLPRGRRYARMLGIDSDIQSRPVSGSLLSFSSQAQQYEKTDVRIDLESPIAVQGSSQDVLCLAEDQTLLLLRTVAAGGGSITLLNTHTYDQADFDAIGEVLLCPRPLGLLDMKGAPLRRLRQAFRSLELWVFEGPASLTYHPFSSSSESICVVQNFNDAPAAATVRVSVRQGESVRFVDRLTGERLPREAVDSADRVVVSATIGARDRVWIQRARTGSAP